MWVFITFFVLVLYCTGIFYGVINSTLESSLVGFVVLFDLFIFSFLARSKHKIDPFIRNTYLFWLVVSCSNVYIFLSVAFPLFLPFSMKFFGRFSEFLILPLTYSVCAIYIFSVLCRWFPKLYEPRNKELFPIIFNGLFLTVFIISAEYHKEKLMEKALGGHHPDCIEVKSFIGSIGEAGKERHFSHRTHAIFRENEKNFIWSYSLQNFVEAGSALGNRFSCNNNRKILPDGRLMKI